MNTFVVVDQPSAYNAIIGRPLMKYIKMVDAVYCLKVKFPTPSGVGYMQTDQYMARQCHLLSLVIAKKAAEATEELAALAEGSTRGQQSQPMELSILIGESVNQAVSSCELSLEILDTRDEQALNKPQPVEETLSIPLNEGDPSKVTQIGSKLTAQEQSLLVEILQKNVDVFAWTPADMPGIHPSVISHLLNVDPRIKPVKQKKRRFAPDRLSAIREEVDKLLIAGFIQEVHYPEWVANVVLVKKPTGKWRMCVDFIDLNKACPKDSFPLPSIDQHGSYCFIGSCYIQV